jgi:hypothetical protein
LLEIKMKEAETSASIATAAWTPLTVVSRSSTTAEIETFMNDVSITNTNIAAASRIPSRGVPCASAADSISGISTACSGSLPGRLHA